jgi:hypothetical protein
MSMILYFVMVILLEMGKVFSLQYIIPFVTQQFSTLYLRFR